MVKLTRQNHRTILTNVMETMVPISQQVMSKRILQKLLSEIIEKEIAIITRTKRRGEGANLS